jgi:hypothetical protein
VNKIHIDPIQTLQEDLMSQTFHVAIAQSDDVDEEDAITEVLDACAEQLGDRVPKAGLLFVAIDYEHEIILAAIQERYPGVQIIGGTSDGEIASAKGYLEDSITLVLFASDVLEFRAALAKNLGADPAAATQQVIAETTAGRTDTPSMCWIVPDGLTANISIVLRTLQAQFGQAFPILGGTAGDHWEFSRCFQFCNGEVVQDGIPMLMVFGEVKMSIGVASGWQPVGRKMVVTDIDGSVLKSIDGRSAFEIFQEHFGDQIRSAFGEYPLAVYPNGDEEEWHYLRAIYQVDEEAGHVILAAEIPTGSTISLTNVIRERILEGAQASMKAALDGWGEGQPELMVIVSCAARKWLLGDQAAAEFDVLQAEMQRQGVDIPLIGFYSFGEIAPLGGESRFHNETCVSIALGIAA